MNNPELLVTILLKSRDKNDDYLIKRANFCLNAKELLDKEKDKTLSDPIGKISRFKQHNKTFFSRYQLEDDISGYYAEQILKSIS